MSGPREVPAARPPARWAAVAWLATAMLLAMTTWFSASAVVPQLRDLWSLSPAAASMLTIAVQLGFVVGAVTSALPSIADLVPPRHSWRPVPSVPASRTCRCSSRRVVL